jgi:hypothetical protein
VKFLNKPACAIIPCAESMHHPIHLLVDPSIPTPLTKKQTFRKEEQTASYNPIVQRLQYTPGNWFLVSKQNKNPDTRSHDEAGMFQKLIPDQHGSKLHCKQEIQLTLVCLQNHYYGNTFMRLAVTNMQIREFHTLSST